MSNYILHNQLGAISTQQSFRYHDEAISLANARLAQGASYVVVTFEANGRSPVVMPFSNLEMANDAYNDVIDAPGSRVYAAVIDADGVWNEWFGAVTQVFESWFTKEKLKQLAPWIVGGAVIIAGAVYYSRKRPARGRRASARKVRRAIWRRRTVTTWR